MLEFSRGSHPQFHLEPREKPQKANVSLASHINVRAVGKENELSGKSKRLPCLFSIVLLYTFSLSSLKRCPFSLSHFASSPSPQRSSPSSSTWMSATSRACPWLNNIDSGKDFPISTFYLYLFIMRHRWGFLRTCFVCVFLLCDSTPSLRLYFALFSSRTSMVELDF